jgi:uncharacterized membrane protein YebE (DUF533 family)
MPINQLFQTISNNPGVQGAIGGAASGALASLLVHPKSRKKLGKTAMHVGGAAALASVGYYAYKKWQTSQSNQQKPSHSDANNSSIPSVIPSLPSTRAKEVYQVSSQVQITDNIALGMIMSMIAAAAADGNIDDQEMDALLASMESANLSPKENSELTKALNQPPTVEDIASFASNPEEASELYAAALSAIDPATPAEHLHLKRLAKALRLDDSLIRCIHQSVDF